jgi:cation diffusion facilitator family transporter
MEKPHTEYEARYAAGRRVTVWGMILNILLSGSKIAAGIVGRSQAIIADGVHSLSDLGSDIVVLVGLRVSAKPSDETHHYGHARFESLATLAVGVLLVGAGLFIAFESFVGITEHHHVAPTWLPLIAAAISIVAKEGLYQWTKHVGKRIESSSLLANAWHHRTDAF